MIKTAAPAAASAWAMAFPMPCPPPVTRATFLFKEKSFSRIFTTIPPGKITVQHNINTLRLEV
jgi:hypothetical protein